MRKIFPFVLACAFAAAARAEVAPLTAERFVALLTREVAAHFNLEGELQLELLRPWTPPARTAAAWSVAVQEFPAALSSSLLLRCRVLADGAPAGDSALIARAAHWRDVWAVRTPLAAGGGVTTPPSRGSMPPPRRPVTTRPTTRRMPPAVTKQPATPAVATPRARSRTSCSTRWCRCRPTSAS